MKILDLEIPFPDIQGVSQRQELYANSLRELYIRRNEDRFREIDETMQRENDRRLQHENGVDFTYIDSLDDEYTDPEMACLYCEDAHGVIAALKQALSR